jgi:hypothetical protein
MPRKKSPDTNSAFVSSDSPSTCTVSVPAGNRTEIVDKTGAATSRNRSNAGSGKIRLLAS